MNPRNLLSADDNLHFQFVSIDFFQVFHAMRSSANFMYCPPATVQTSSIHLFLGKPILLVLPLGLHNNTFWINSFVSCLNRCPIHCHFSLATLFTTSYTLSHISYFVTQNDSHLFVAVCATLVVLLLFVLLPWFSNHR